MARRARLGAAVDGTSRALSFLGGLATLVMTGLIAFDVLMRYFLNEPQLFVDEVVGFLQVLVVFGGLDLAGYRNDTWVFDGTGWAEVSGAVSPTGRAGWQPASPGWLAAGQTRAGRCPHHCASR